MVHGYPESFDNDCPSLHKNGERRPSPLSSLRNLAFPGWKPSMDSIIPAEFRQTGRFDIAFSLAQ
jgi:hypothetical protein